MTDSALMEALTANMAEPWWRDSLIQTIADHDRLGDLGDWSKRIVEAYGKSGSIEVAACILAFRARAFGPNDREAALHGVLIETQWGPEIALRDDDAVPFTARTARETALHRARPERPAHAVEIRDAEDQA